MAKVVTMQDYLYAKRMSNVIKQEKAEAKQEKREKIKKSLSFITGVILYWIASVIVTMGFFAVALMSL